MSGLIARTRETLSEKVHVVGVLAIAVIAGVSTDEEREEARQLVMAFWRERAGAR